MKSKTMLYFSHSSPQVFLHTSYSKITAHPTYRVIEFKQNPELQQTFHKVKREPKDETLHWAMKNKKKPSMFYVTLPTIENLPSLLPRRKMGKTEHIS